MSAIEKLARRLYCTWSASSNGISRARVEWLWKDLGIRGQKPWIAVARHVLRSETKIKLALSNCYARLTVKRPVLGVDEYAIEQAEKILRKEKR